MRGRTTARRPTGTGGSGRAAGEYRQHDLIDRALAAGKDWAAALRRQREDELAVVETDLAKTEAAIETYLLAFEAGTLVIAWDDDADRLIVEVHSIRLDQGAGESAGPVVDGRDADPDELELSDDDPIGPDVVRLRLAPVMAQRFAKQARAAITARR